MRFGGLKQFTGLEGMTLAERAVAAARAACEGVVLVLPAGVGWDGPQVELVVAGGATRAASVRSGLAAVPGSASLIAVHDAAHPLATSALFQAVLEVVRAGADGAIPVMPVTETVKRVSNGSVVETVPREGLMLVQMPQAFQAAVLRAAHAGGVDAPDDSVLVEAMGATLALVPGDPSNLHVTTPLELQMASRLLAGG